MAIALKKLEDQLNCSVCLDTYTSPKLLQCNHVYCQLCLVKLVFRDQQGQLSLTCPSCRQVTPVPASGVAGLQAAFRVNQLLEIVEEHKKAIITTASPEKLDIATTAISPHSRSIVCPEHDGKEVDLYCETCGETICWKCIMKGSKHHSHEYQELSKAFENYKEELTSLLEPIEKQMSKISNALKQLDVCCDEISSQQAAIESDIHSTITRLQETLNIRKTELISQLHQLTQAKLKSLAVQRDQIETTQAQLSSCLLFMKENLKASNHGEALLVRTTTVRQVKELMIAFESDSLEPDTKADLMFSALADLNAECQKYGKVYEEGPPDPSKCYATGEGVSTAAVGEKSIVILQTLNAESLPCKVSLASVSSEFISEITGNRVEAVVETRAQNQYEIRYLPTIKGRHQLHIKVEGQPITGSPFPVSVSSPVETLGTSILTIGGVGAPSGIAVNSSGEVIVTEFTKDCVTVFSSNGKRLRSFGTFGDEDGQFHRPSGVAVDVKTNDIFVADGSNHRIQKFTAQGDFLMAVGTKGTGPLQFTYPRGIAISTRTGRVYLASGSNCVQILNPDLSYFGTLTMASFDPWQLAFDSTGNVYVTDCDNHRIQVFTAEGTFLRMFGRHGWGRGELDKPLGIAIDSSDRVYVSQRSSDCISVFTCEGEFVISFRTGRAVGRLTVDNGVVYVCNPYNYCIELF